MTDEDLKSELIEWAETLADGIALIRRAYRRWKTRSTQ
jgi:hypothetical protein